MKILGIDYGRSKIGLALSEGKLAEPLKVVHYKEVGEVIKKIVWIVEEEVVGKVIVGVSEGEMGKESKNFSLNLSKSLSIPVETFDETLSTKGAQTLSIEAGIKRGKRKKMEDAFAATLTLQDYLDSQA